METSTSVADKKTTSGGTTKSMSSGNTSGSDTTFKDDKTNENSGTLVARVLEQAVLNDPRLKPVKKIFDEYELDADEVLRKAKEYATMAYGNAKTYTAQNPAAVLTGIAAVIVGAGLLATSFKNNEPQEWKNAS